MEICADLALLLRGGEFEDGDVAEGVEGVQEVKLKQLRHATPHTACLVYTKNQP